VLGFKGTEPAKTIKAIIESSQINDYFLIPLSRTFTFFKGAILLLQKSFVRKGTNVCWTEGQHYTSLQAKGTYSRDTGLGFLENCILPASALAPINSYDDDHT
jgi:hypothetical protein